MLKISALSPLNKMKLQREAATGEDTGEAMVEDTAAGIMADMEDMGDTEGIGGIMATIGDITAMDIMDTIAIIGTDITGATTIGTGIGMQSITGALAILGVIGIGMEEAWELLLLQVTSTIPITIGVPPRR